MSKDKNVTSRNENAPKINLTLRSKVTWKLWYYVTHHLIVAHLHRRYNKSVSKDIKVTTEHDCVSIWRRIIRRSNPTKTICLSSWKGRDIICSCWTCKYGQTFCLNIWMSLKEAIWILYILLTLPTEMNIQFLNIAKQVAERFQHARAFICGSHHQNTLKSCNYSSNESLIKQASYFI